MPDRTEVDMINPNADIYSSSDTGSEFYVPGWLATMIVDGEKVDGQTPSFEWWQELGAEERSLLQSEHEADGDDTTLMAIHRIVGGVAEEATLSLNASGDIVAEWSDDGPYTTSGVDYGYPMASFDEAMLYLISNNSEWLHPMYGGVFEPTVTSLNESGDTFMRGPVGPLAGLSVGQNFKEDGINLQTPSGIGVDYRVDPTLTLGGDVWYRQLATGEYEQRIYNDSSTSRTYSLHGGRNTASAEAYSYTEWLPFEWYITKADGSPMGGTGRPDSGSWTDSVAHHRRLMASNTASMDHSYRIAIAEASGFGGGPLFTEDEFAVFRDHFGEYLEEKGLEFNTLVPPNLSDEDLGSPSAWASTGWRWTTPGQTGQIAPFGGPIDERGNHVAFNPEDFFREYLGQEGGYEMTDSSKFGFWTLMDKINPFYNQYQDWWDGMYTDELAVPSFSTFANNPEQTRIYAGPKPNEEDFQYPGSYLAAAREWDEKVRDGYAQVLAIASNNFAPDPMLQWLASNTGIIESNADIDLEEEDIDLEGGDDGMARGGLVSLAVGGPVPPQGIGGLEGGLPPGAGMGGGGMPEMLPGQMPSLPMENMDIATAIQSDPILMGAAMAILGQHPDPQSAIQQAVSAYGEEIVQALVQAISQQGALQGPGDGLSDSIPATIDGQQPAKLSSGEFVVPADVVSHLGNGDNQSGASSLQGMMERARQQRTGNPQSPPAIDPSMVMPA